MTSQPSLLKRSGDVELLRIIVTTAGLLFLGGLMNDYQSVLRGVYQHTLTLSAVEWVVYTFGAFLIEPILLFGILYYVGTHTETTAHPITLLAGLSIAVVAGSVLGQYVGIEMWGSSAFTKVDVPLVAVWNGLLVPELSSLSYWYALVEPLARDLLTAVAALGLASIVEKTD